MFQWFCVPQGVGRIFAIYFPLFFLIRQHINTIAAERCAFSCAFGPKFKFRFRLEFRFVGDLFRQINKWHVQSVNLSSCRRTELKISARKSLCNGERSPDASCSMPNAQMLSVGIFMARLLILSVQSACHISGEHISLLCDIANAFCLTQ